MPSGILRLANKPEAVVTRKRVASHFVAEGEAVYAIVDPWRTRFTADGGKRRHPNQMRRVNMKSIELP